MILGVAFVRDIRRLSCVVSLSGDEGSVGSRARISNGSVLLCALNDPTDLHPHIDFALFLYPIIYLYSIFFFFFLRVPVSGSVLGLGQHLFSRCIIPVCVLSGGNGDHV